jgi:GDP-L-fucose synthase
MSFWSSKRITVTGGAGFLGSFIVEKLKERCCGEIFVPRSFQYDLVDMEAVKRLYRDARPDIVIHLAARVGGIGANRANPGKFFYDNAMIGIQLKSRGGSSGWKSLSRSARFAPIPS